MLVNEYRAALQFGIQKTKNPNVEFGYFGMNIFAIKFLACLYSIAPPPKFCILVPALAEQQLRAKGLQVIHF